jgi:hypothetical protein
LMALFGRTLPAALAAIASGEPLVEISDWI